MNNIFFLSSSILVFIGIFNILLDWFNISTLKSKKILTNYGKAKEVNLSGYDLLKHNITVKISRYVILSQNKEIYLTKTLKSAKIYDTPKMYYAKAITDALIVLVLGVFLLLVHPLLTLVFICISVYVYLNGIDRADQLIVKKKKAIERQLPRFVGTVAQSLKRSRNIIEILETYMITAEDELKDELKITVSDMKSGNQELALARLDSRLNSSMVSEVVKGLISAMTGNDAISYFNRLSEDYKKKEVSDLMFEASKQPDKIMVYVGILAIAAIITLVSVLGYTAMKSVGGGI